MDVERVARTANELGENPLWHPQRKLLYWVDAFGQKIQTYDPAGGNAGSRPVGRFVISLAFRASGGLLMATDTGCAFLPEEEGEPEEVLRGPFDPARVRFNDGRVGPGGRYYLGSMHREEKEPAGALYRLDPDRSFHEIERETITSNGLGWSPDGRIFYYTDSIRRTIYAYDFDPKSGAIARRRPFVESTEEAGVPDGLTVDAEGCLWSARWDGWKVTRYDPDGRKMLELPMPVARPTSCAFGDEGLDSLYVTSAAYGLGAAHLREHPLSGDLFRLRPGVRGRSEELFTG